MKHTIFQDKAFKIMEWILFIGFSIVAGWFASGVLEHFFSRKTSFSQGEEKDTIYPVVVILFLRHNASEVNLTNAAIIYTEYIVQIIYIYHIFYQTATSIKNASSMLRWPNLA